MHHAVIHPLTPGSPAYALAKLGAVGGLFALRMFFVRRDRRANRPAPAEEPPAAPDPAPHPVSRRKARRSRKRR